MAVGLPAQATLDASIFFTVFKSITIHGSYVGTRQDALEAIEIAATGHVKCTYKKLGLKDIEKYVHSCYDGSNIDAHCNYQSLRGYDCGEDCWTDRPRRQ